MSSLLSKTDIRLIVTDMDGTFLDSCATVPEENRSVVRQLSASGIPVIFCTGRPVSFVREYVRMTGASEIVIGCNGAAIQNSTTDELLEATVIAPSAAESVLSFCTAHHLDCCAYTASGTVFFSKESERIAVFRAYNERAAYTGGIPVPLLPLETYGESVLPPVCKILITELQSGDIQRVTQHLQNRDDVSAVSSMHGVLDIMAAPVSKGVAVKKIAEIFKVPVKQIGAIGDNRNDVSMFSVVGVSVCMHNGVDEAKRRATYVTRRTNDEAGFAEAVRIVLRGK
ncbi:MAG: HAD family hydrolase [Treponema sp.]|nr:HAD family hydrolase [Treponema sp.]